MAVTDGFLIAIRKLRKLFHANKKLSAKKLYKAYSDWCEENNEHPVSERFFTLRLKEIGFEQGRTSTERFWVGIGLLD